MSQHPTQQRWTVGETAELTRVSVRTLHHYDATRLLMPSERSEAGYRLYTPGDLTRLYRILSLRELGFPLAQIGRLLEADPAEQRRAMELQAALLREQLRNTERKLRAVTSLLQEEQPMSQQDIKRMFDDFDHGHYEEEAQQRWGDTDAYRQSAERMGRSTPADMERMKTEGAELHARYVALMEAGIPADSPQAAAVAEAHRAYFHQWFYDCSPGMLRGVSNLWVNDPRFTANIDKIKPGLAAYQHAAVQAWAAAQS